MAGCLRRLRVVYRHWRVFPPLVHSLAGFLYRLCVLYMRWRVFYTACAFSPKQRSALGVLTYFQTNGFRSLLQRVAVRILSPDFVPRSFLLFPCMPLNVVPQFCPPILSPDFVPRFCHPILPPIFSPDFVPRLCPPILPSQFLLPLCDPDLSSQFVLQLVWRVL